MARAGAADSVACSDSGVVRRRAATRWLGMSIWTVATSSQRSRMMQWPWRMLLPLAAVLMPRTRVWYGAVCGRPRSSSKRVDLFAGAEAEGEQGGDLLDQAGELQDRGRVLGVQDQGGAEGTADTGDVVQEGGAVGGLRQQVDLGDDDDLGAAAELAAARRTDHPGEAAAEAGHADAFDRGPGFGCRLGGRQGEAGHLDDPEARVRGQRRQAGRRAGDDGAEACLDQVAQREADSPGGLGVGSAEPLDDAPRRRVGRLDLGAGRRHDRSFGRTTQMRRQQQHEL